MAWWGIALASGPNINYPFVDEQANKVAYEAIQKAMSLSGSVTPVERDLIRAQAKRFAMPAPADRYPWTRPMPRRWGGLPQPIPGTSTSGPCSPNR